MLLKTKGIPHLLQEPIVGRVTKRPDGSSGTIWIADAITAEIPDVDCLLTQSEFTTDTIIDMPSVYQVPGFEHLQEGDIVVVNPSGTINTLYRVNSSQNFLLFTERCNSNCLMCSQPPKQHDDTRHLYDIHRQLIPLIPKSCAEIGITGGEPTLMGTHFFELLHQIKTDLPQTEVHCLTNGRSFAWKQMARQLEKLEFNRLMLGIPLYADYYQVHDYIVQAKHAFYQTLQGLYNLAEFGQRIEIRVVLHQQSIPRLVKLAKFIYKNIPFAEHVTFMGLENQGYTPFNIDKLWIDPVDYMKELEEAVEFLSIMGMHVSIYNSQLCTMPESLWKYNRKSISDWKNIYLDACNKCSVFEECGGLFASCQNMHSRALRPLGSEIIDKTRNYEMGRHSRN
jgi:His-Xaa-Ser system radical SAM maturase HxsC